MGCSGHTHRSNARYLAASVAGTLLIYTARWITADKHDQHLRWRCPVPLSAALFAGGQLSGVVAFAFKELRSLSRRGRDEPPVAGPLALYLFVSATSAVMLGFVLSWAAGLSSPPRCLSGSAACLRLRENLEQTGWITVALLGLVGCQLVGAVAAARSLCCPGVDPEAASFPRGVALPRPVEPREPRAPPPPMRPPPRFAMAESGGGGGGVFEVDVPVGVVDRQPRRAFGGGGAAAGGFVEGVAICK